MTALGPFETNPQIAVAVSGGSDSIALVILADKWARLNGGDVTALTVNHNLREGSAKEVAQVGNWLAKRRIKHVVLSWEGKKPITGIQQAARDERYRLMDQWCQRNYVLHLLLGHTQDDQAETLLMRLERGSGPDGLAAMSVQRELNNCRLLRPVLDCSRNTLRNFLEYQRQDWLDDPSNCDGRFLRTHLRHWIVDAGLSPEELTKRTKRYGLARKAAEYEANRTMALGGSFFSAGYARIKISCLTCVSEDVALLVIARLIAIVGGLFYKPSRTSVKRLYKRVIIGSNAKMTLGRCLLRIFGAYLEVYRERRNLPDPVIFEAGRSIIWDGRFELVFGRVPLETRGNLYLQSLSRRDWYGSRVEKQNFRFEDYIPTFALAGLPALYDDRGIVTVPHLEYCRNGQWLDNSIETGINKVCFRPYSSVSFGSFCVD
ncbi:MAG: tRNA lysidine(34) synthetase TilS [Magnetovibrio sp.]|nr:tRNA lysidine(34) synthetase TilS [Magnetovibrio sp.]|tara:strand:+ start:1636 stop:2931 length:1296 start_codon:yes stop_codon:yes gene_type:complete